MTTRDNAVQGVRETARATASTVVEGVVSGIITVGAATPVVQTFCIALQEAKGIVDEAKRNKEQLGKLHERCELITVQVINKAKASRSSEVDFTPLEKCVDDIKALAERYNAQGCCARLVQFRRDGDDIEGLRETIEAVVPVMGLSAGVTAVDQNNQILALLQSRPELAPVPLDLPRAKSWQWHVRRHQVENSVCEILGGDKPAVAALTGGSGAGKSTAAAAMVGERGSIRPRAGENEDQALARLDRLRALFPHGVVWLRVGKGAGAPDRLPVLMRDLAVGLGKLVGGVGAPGAGEDGGRYVATIVEEKSKRCLVVADDVWENEVVEKLRETGMWVLLTTRPRPDSTVDVGVKETVVMDTLTEPEEAENILRGAAGLPPGERLCDAAMKVLEICGRVAMDIAFVGSWTSVRTTNGIHKSKKAWKRTVEEITAQIAHVREQMNGRDAGEDDDRAINRRAVLRAGFKYLAIQDPLAQELYAALAVFPDDHFFEESDAAVLVDVREGTNDQVLILEQWGVLKADASDKYRMHDAHMDFAREKLMRWEDVREPAVERWTKHISRLEFAVGVDVYALLRMWRALEGVGGKGWWVTRPYDDQLVQVDALDPLKTLAVRVVAEVYVHDGKDCEYEELMRKILEQGDAHGGDCVQLQMMALYYIRNALAKQWRHRGLDDVMRRLGELGGPGAQLPLPSDGDGFLQISTTFSMYGVCARAAGRMEIAEEWFRKALTAQETGGLTTSYQAVFVMVELGECAQIVGRFEDAEAWFVRALEIEEAKLGPDDVQVAYTLSSMGGCMLGAGKYEEAEALYKRALKIREVKLGPDDVQVAYTLHKLAVSVQEAGRPGDAVPLFERALEIDEAKLGPDDVQVAYTLHQLAVSVREAGRPGDAVPLFERALEIEEAKLGPDDDLVAYTLYWLAVCVREAGRPGDAVPLFERALEIKEAKLGPDDVQVAYTLHELAVSVREAGRPGDAVPLFERALEIKKAKLGPDDVGVAVTRFVLAQCVEESGGPAATE